VLEQIRPLPNQTERPPKGDEMIYRCYVARSYRRQARWLARCIDLDLCAVGDDPKSAKDSLVDAITGYVDTVLDTTDQDSIQRLLHRRAPWRYVFWWRLLRVLFKVQSETIRPPQG
jgi:hypothetical protein